MQVALKSGQWYVVVLLNMAFFISVKNAVLVNSQVNSHRILLKCSKKTFEMHYMLRAAYCKIICIAMWI